MSPMPIDGNNHLLLPYSPDQSRPDGFKLCPIRAADTPHCWGARCAAFKPVNAWQGVCLLIEGGAK
jgi:hypothetical protein